MKTKKLLITLILVSGIMVANAQTVLDFTTTGSCASYIKWHNSNSLSADSIYSIEKTNLPITVDGDIDGVWSRANAMPIANILHEKRDGGVLDLSAYPQSEAYAHAVYRALWTETGVYMLIQVKDNNIRYQNPEYQWENDGIEFYFAKERGAGKAQIIIPAMVGTTNPLYPAALNFESGSATGSNAAFRVFGYDATNWDATLFKWAIKKTADGYIMEVYMDKDIVTNGNSATNYGLNKMFAGDINLDIAGLKQNTNTPSLYVREASLGLLGNSNQEYAGSNYYGWFKMVDNTPEFTTTGSAASYITWNNSKSLQSDSIYSIEKTANSVVIDGVEDASWTKANAKVISKILHEKRAGDVLDLSAYPQTEAYAHAVYKALWNDNGVYMFIQVKDNNIRYQNPEYQWENDGIEFYFAKERGAGKAQIIIPAMVGTTNPLYPTAKDFESGSATGSNPAFKVFGYDVNNWDASLFNWAIKKTADGYNMEVYMDKDIVTNGNSATNYGLDKIFAGDINLDVAGLKQNTNTPALYVREVSLGLLGNSNQEYAGSNYYGWFKLVNTITGLNSPKDAKFNALYNAACKEVKIVSNELVSVSLYNIAGQVMPTTLNNGVISVSHLNKGIYIVYVKELKGNSFGTQKLVIY